MPITTSPPLMAVVLDHHCHPFKPRHRRRRLLSFPHPDLNLFDLTPSCTPLQSPKPFAATIAAALPFHRSLSTPCLHSSSSAQDKVRLEIIMGRRAHGVHALVVEAAIALASGSRPVPAPTGTGGAYYLPNRDGQTFAVVKPVSDEPVSLALGKPRLSRSISPGETGVREVAAYLLDHGGFSGVPPTALVSISHPSFLPNKMASIQRFVPHEFDAGELGPSRFSVASVHRVGILDIRLLNVDRHSGNILVKCSLAGTSPGAELVPIDHGLCLPELLEDPYFEWLHWPQAFMPFSETESDYIASLDPYRDAELLRSELPLLREPSLRILILCTIFLKKAAAAGLCLADIGDMMTRGLGASVLETICVQVEAEGYSSRAGIPRMEEELVEDAAGGDPDEEGFVFDMDCDDSDFTKEAQGVEVEVDVPVLLRSRPRAPTKLLSFRSMSGKALRTLDEESCFSAEEGDAIVEENSSSSGAAGGGDEEEEEHEEDVWVDSSLTRSVSFTVSDPNHHGGSSRGRCLSFKGMSEQEWVLFLERFEELLPEAFEERKNMGFLKQKLGSSCKF